MTWCHHDLPGNKEIPVVLIQNTLLGCNWPLTSPRAWSITITSSTIEGQSANKHVK